MNDRWTIGLLLAVAVALGAMREFVFVNLNYQLDHVARDTAFSYAHSIFQRWTAGMGLPGLRALKWAMALFFILTMTGLSTIAARQLFGDHRYMRTIFFGVGTVGTVALVFHALSLDLAAVKLLHALQYPVVLVILVLVRPLVRP